MSFALADLGRLVIGALRIITIGYVGYLAFLFLVQRAVAFPGARLPTPRAPESPVPDPVHRIWLTTPSGPVEAWFLPPEGEGRRPVIVFAHGNGELIDFWIDEARRWRQMGVGVLLVEFPGYGLSAGRTTRATIAAAFAAAYDWLLYRPDVDPVRIAVMGRSLGGGAATDLADARPVRALILLSTFSSARRVAWRRFGALPFIVRDAFDNRAALSRFDGPVLVVHGTRDEILPFAEAERLAGARTGIELVGLPCGHNDCPRDWEAFASTIRRFLTGHGIL